MTSQNLQPYQRSIYSKLSWQLAVFLAQGYKSPGRSFMTPCWTDNWLSCCIFLLGHKWWSRRPCYNWPWLRWLHKIPNLIQEVFQIACSFSCSCTTRISELKELIYDLNLYWLATNSESLVLVTIDFRFNDFTNFTNPESMYSKLAWQRAVFLAQGYIRAQDTHSCW